MTSTLTEPVASVLDLRVIAPHERHATIFGLFDALRPGQSLQFLSDHAPQPLRYQFEDRSYGQFEWAALEKGPTLWRVQITRSASRAALPAGDSCCSGGACGG